MESSSQRSLGRRKKAQPNRSASVRKTITVPWDASFTASVLGGGVLSLGLLDAVVLP